ncbi:MAG: elongation factor Ts, partial [Planctomycetes bacterium]|nr:elongation factor Ts [Planctomycetota bacterium]
KFYEEKCLLEQRFIKDETLTIQQLVTAMIAKTGENCRIKRFVRFAIER